MTLILDGLHLLTDPTVLHELDYVLEPPDPTRSASETNATVAK